MKIRTICRCDEDGKPAGQHSPDCPLQADLYAEALKALMDREHRHAIWCRRKYLDVIVCGCQS